MEKTGSPKKLWDYLLELEALIRSNTAHHIYQLKGEVPETMVSGEILNISSFCELEWYEWVKYRDNTAPYPQDKLKPGRYLGPSIDIGPAMTAKILKVNGQVEHHSTYCSLTPEEIASLVLKAEQEAFDSEIEQRLGPAGKTSDFTDDLDVVT